MIMDLRKLQGNEILIFQEMLHKYLQYDKIDLIIHKTLKCMGISKDDFKNRNAVKEKEDKPYIKINAPPAEIVFCDGDSCELPVFIKEKC